MNKPIFKVDKLCCYQEGARHFEDFTVYMNGNLLFSAYRNEIEELVHELSVALNDRKEVEHEEK